MEYYSESNRPPIVAHRATNSIVPIYEEVINTKTCKKELKKVGSTNLYQKIQESRDSTDIQKIIERYQIKLDNKPVVREEILDYTENPTSLIEAKARILQAENIWKGEAVDVKARFNNSFEQYLNAANSGELKKVYAELAPKKYKKVEEVKENFIEPTQTTTQQTTQATKGVTIYE